MTIKKNNLNFLWKEIFFNRKLVLISLLFSVLIVNYISISQPYKISLKLIAKVFPSAIEDMYFDVYKNKFLNNESMSDDSENRNFILETEIAKNIFKNNQLINKTKVEEKFAQNKKKIISELEKNELIINSVELIFSTDASYLNLKLDLYKKIQKNKNPFKIQPKLETYNIVDDNTFGEVKVYLLKFLNEDLGFNSKIVTFYFEDIKMSQKTEKFKYLSSIIFLFLSINFIYAVIKFRKKIFI